MAVLRDVCRGVRTLLGQCQRSTAAAAWIHGQACKYQICSALSVYSLLQVCTLIRATLNGFKAVDLLIHDFLSVMSICLFFLISENNHFWT